MRRLVTDVALLSYIAKKDVDVISYSEATKACKSSSSASRALHQLIKEGLIEPRPKLIGLRYVTEYAVTPRGKQVAKLALQLTVLRERSTASKETSSGKETTVPKMRRTGKKVSHLKAPAKVIEEALEDEKIMPDVH